MKIGMDIGGSHIAMAVIDSKGKIIEKQERNFTDEDRIHIEEVVENTIIETVKKWKKTYPITQIGIAMPGNAEEGVVLSSGNLKIKKGYPLGKNLQEKLEVPVWIGNDAKCAALAENEYGCLKGAKSGVFLTLGTGIGGAFFLQGELLKGTRRQGYSFGHMVIKENGISCSCGREGCFERYGSMKAFKDKLRQALELEPSVDGEELVGYLKNNHPGSENDKKIEQMIEEYTDDLTTGIANLFTIFEPEIIGIGGSFVYFTEFLLPKLEEKLKRENEKKIGRGDIPIRIAELGNEAGIIGSVLF